MKPRAQLHINASSRHTILGVGDALSMFMLLSRLQQVLPPTCYRRGAISNFCKEQCSAAAVTIP